MKANCSWVLSCVSVQQQVKKRKEEASKNVFNMESRPESIFKEERGSYSAMFQSQRGFKACASALTRMADSAIDSGP